MGRNRKRKRKGGPEELTEASGVAGPPSKKSAPPQSALETIRSEYSDKSPSHSQQKPNPAETNESPQKHSKEGDSPNPRKGRCISRPLSVKPSNKNIRYICA